MNSILQMDKDNFDPKTFFALHDLNGDGYWNDDELEALFQIELEKVYNETNPDDDPRERIEEMYRMREHVVKQVKTLFWFAIILWKINLKLHI